MGGAECTCIVGNDSLCAATCIHDCGVHGGPGW